MISEIHRKLKKGEISCTELIDKIFDKIHNSKLNCYITLFEKKAKEKAKIIDKEKNFHHLLTGIPIAIKDNICIKGEPTTCASKILKNFIPPYNATVIEKLESVGAIFIGKTNMDEFAMGSSTENSAFGITFNPYNQEHVSGGSSGGSAACVANNEAICALGSDTGGSVRQPASFCGVVGLKPTYGRVSRYGLVAFASSLDQIGVITSCVEDAAILLEVISGFDNKDSTSVNIDVPHYFDNLSAEIKNIKIGLPKEYFGEGLDKIVKEKVLSAVKILEDAIIEDITLPHTEYTIPVYYLIATAEASSNLARYDGIRYGYRYEDKNITSLYEETRSIGFGAEVKRRILLGTFALQAGYYDEYYLKARNIRYLIKEDFDNAFNKVDVIITPTTPTLPFKVGEKINDPLSMCLSDIYTVSINLAGLPAISIPCGFHNNLPIGMQIIGKQFDEQTILNIAYKYETKIKLTMLNKINFL